MSAFQYSATLVTLIGACVFGLCLGKLFCDTTHKDKKMTSQDGIDACNQRIDRLYDMLIQLEKERKS